MRGICILCAAAAAAALAADVRADSRQSAVAVYQRGGDPPGAWTDSDFADLGMLAHGGPLDDRSFEAARKVLQGACRGRAGPGGGLEGRAAEALRLLGPDDVPGGEAEIGTFRKAVSAAARSAAALEAGLGAWTAGIPGAAPASKDPLSAEVAAHVRILRENWPLRDRLAIVLSMGAFRSASPAKLAEALSALRDGGAFRARNMRIAAGAADLKSGVFYLFVKRGAGGRDGPPGGERLSASGRLDCGSNDLGSEGMKLWLNAKLRRYFLLVGVSGKPSTGDFTVPVILRVRGGDAHSFLSDAGRSPWKILKGVLSVSAKVTADKSAKIDVKAQALPLLSAILPPEIRADINAEFTFETGDEADRRNAHEMNVLAGTGAFTGFGLGYGRDPGLQELLPGFLTLSLSGKLLASEDWGRQDASALLSGGAFFPFTPFDLAGLTPGTPRAVHESFWSAALSFGYRSRIAGQVSSGRSGWVLGMEIRLVQPLPVELIEIAGSVIGNDADDAAEAGSQGKGGDEMSFPVITLRWWAWWLAPQGRPFRFSKSGFFSAVELEIKIPLGAGISAFLSYSDGSIPLFEKGSSEFGTGIEVSF